MTISEATETIFTSDGRLTALVALANSDGETQLHSRGWTGSLTLGVDGAAYRIEVSAGLFRLSEPSEPETSGDCTHVVAVGTGEQWSTMLQTVPPPGLTDVFGGQFLGMTLTPRNLSGELRLAVRRVVELLRHIVNGTDPTPQVVQDSRPHGTFDAARGRYVHLHIDGHDHRIYFEEAGSGIGLLCQHTAGTDGRQWRHLLEDERVTSRFRVIAYDLPHHGKSLPPSGVAWWAQEYRLTRGYLMQIPIALANALGLDRPAFIGSSVGGMLALDLARFHPDDFRAVVSCEGALYAVPDHAAPRPNDGTLTVGSDPAQHAASMMSFMGATAPESYRHETRLHYAQGAPGVFPGDIAYFRGDHDLRGQAHLIDTARCPVHMLTGNYDFLTMPLSERAAEEIPNVSFMAMPGLGHFPMSEDPERFIGYLLPILDAIAAR
ncbi:Carboxylesterase (modular protein) [Frankia canadensis]|uniref:Carboxylesterase (Modular protein) n=1 Tax=Frankia canadensis TaxID=1836972 RepID=A0A2I2KI15_9ACTN|nr:alpha/beta hydrolase [Frankia canadensis]SNQ45302.1 Carboxylesterase (modular protein) [Frankia canadensis]SOU52592.1 Carboxylesterase (modular protein) [Frankia canadensis]